MLNWLRVWTANTMSGRVLIAVYMSEPMAAWYGTSEIRSESDSVGDNMVLASKGVETELQVSMPKCARIVSM